MTSNQELVIGVAFVTIIGIGAAYWAISRQVSPLSRIHERMSQADKALVVSCQDNTSMSFKGCVEVVNLRRMR